MEPNPFIRHGLSAKVAGVGKLHIRFTALFEGPDGAAYLPRWDIRPEAISRDSTFGFVVQKVRRVWRWCPFLLVTQEAPIEVNSLRKWRSVVKVSANIHEHRPTSDADGVTGMEG